MATRTKAAAKPKAAPRAALLEKEPTQLHTDFVDYIRSETGYTDVDPKTVQLSVLLRMDFQRSEQNQARISASKAGKQEAIAARQAKKAEREAARLEKQAAKEAKANEPKAEKPAKAAKPEPVSKAPAKKAPARRRAAKKAPAAAESF